MKSGIENRAVSEVHVTRVVSSLLVLAGLVMAFQPQSGVRSDKPVGFPEGGMRAVMTGELMPNLDVEHESWAYRVLLEGDLQVALDFRRADLGSFKGKVLGGNLSVLGFRGQNYSVAREYPPENLVYSHEDERVGVHPNMWFEGQLPERHRLHYATRKGGVAYFLDLEFDDIAPGYSWGDSRFEFEDRTTDLIIHIPYARVSGLLAINEDTMRVSGTAYMDHVSQSDRASKFADGGYRYISHQKDWEVGLYLRPKKDYHPRVAGYGLARRNGRTVLIQPQSMDILSESKVEGKKVAREILFIDRDSTERLLVRKRNVQKISLLREVGGLKKFLAKRFAGGDVITFRGWGQINGTRSMYYDYFVLD